MRTTKTRADLNHMALIQQLLRFRQNTRGNVALTFALLLLPLLAAVGVAIDYTAASRQRAVIQASLDAAMLAGAIAGKASLDAGASNSTAIAAANTAAENSFKSNIGTAISATLSADFKMNGLSISGTGSASAAVGTTFMAIFGYKTTAIAATSQTASSAQPMTWDWGYNATLGQPGSLGGATRVDDIPIALKKCAGQNFTIASDVTAIQTAFTNLFVKASPIRLTK
jgi:Flp pilus assembly protein TadG